MAGNMDPWSQFVKNGASDEVSGWSHSFLAPLGLLFLRRPLSSIHRNSLGSCEEAGQVAKVFLLLLSLP